MAATKIPCPACESADTRPLTRKELRERHGGQDPLVVVMPQTCTACEHVWEPPLSRGTCYLVVAVAAVGFLIGSVLFVVCACVLVYSLMAPEGGANTMRSRTATASFAVLGLGLAAGAGALGRTYLRLARNR